MNFQVINIEVIEILYRGVMGKNVGCMGKTLIVHYIFFLKYSYLVLLL